MVMLSYSFYLKLGTDYKIEREREREKERERERERENMYRLALSDRSHTHSLFFNTTNSFDILPSLL